MGGALVAKCWSLQVGRGREETFHPQWLRFAVPDAHAEWDMPSEIASDAIAVQQYHHLADELATDLRAESLSCPPPMGFARSIVARADIIEDEANADTSLAVIPLHDMMN